MEYLSQFEELKARKLNLDLTRGKPAKDQLNLSTSIDSLEINDYIFSSNQEDISLTEKVKLTAKKYASLNDNRLILAPIV